MMRKILPLLVLMLFTYSSYSQTSNESYESCSVEKDFKEPKKLKKLKEHISVDLDQDIDSIIILRVSEELGRGIYTVCVAGKKYKYRKVGNVYYKDGEDPLKLN